MCSVKAPTVVPSSSVNPLGALTRHVTMTVTPVIGEPPSGKRVALNVSWPPSTPGFGPPKATKLVNPVAAQDPLATTLPAALNWVNEPLATMPLALKLPAPVVLIISPLLGSTAVLGFCSTKPDGSLEVTAARNAVLLGPVVSLPHEVARNPTARALARPNAGRILSFMATPYLPPFLFVRLRRSVGLSGVDRFPHSPPTWMGVRDFVSAQSGTQSAAVNARSMDSAYCIPPGMLQKRPSRLGELSSLRVAEGRLELPPQVWGCTHQL